MARQTIATPHAPAPIASYSQASRIGPVLAVAGQVGVDATGTLVGTAVADQTEQALVNLRNVLAAAGASLDDVVRIDAFVADLTDLGSFNDVYARWFPLNPPARTTVVVGLTPGLKVELTALAVLAP